MRIDSMEAICAGAREAGMQFWEAVLSYDMEERQCTREESMAKMLTVWTAMVDASDSYTGQRRSVSGLVGGDGLKMRMYNRRGESLCGDYVGRVIAEALSMAESNACMRRMQALDSAMDRASAITRPT